MHMLPALPMDSILMLPDSVPQALACCSFLLLQSSSVCHLFVMILHTVLMLALLQSSGGMHGN